MATLTEKEFAVIEHIGSNGGRITQREIAHRANLSLGLTNLILKKLTREGYIKIKQLTPRSMHYIVTKKGMVERVKKSYSYIFKTISDIQRIKHVIQRLISDEYEKGNRVFGIFGDGELTDIVEVCCRNISDIEIKRFGNGSSIGDFNNVDVILDCENSFRTKNDISKTRIIYLIDYITNHKG